MARSSSEKRRLSTDSVRRASRRTSSAAWTSTFSMSMSRRLLRYTGGEGDLAQGKVVLGSNR